jgi:hypothetical protein
VVRAQRAHRLSRAPDLLIINLLEFTRKILAVRTAPLELKRIARLGTVAHTLVELLKDQAVGRLEYGGPSRARPSVQSSNMHFSCNP